MKDDGTPTNVRWEILISPLYCCNEYLVDNDGYIISKRDHRRMRPHPNHRGYLATTLMINGKRKTLPIRLAITRTFLGDEISEDYK